MTLTIKLSNNLFVLILIFKVLAPVLTPKVQTPQTQKAPA